MTHKAVSMWKVTRNLILTDVCVIALFWLIPSVKMLALLLGVLCAIGYMLWLGRCFLNDCKANLPGEDYQRIAAEFGFDACFTVCGQTYPRKLDSRILNVLSSIAQSCYRFANDVRLLQHDRQLEEPFESTQVGSSAMAYKRNPMRCERICSLARYVMADALNAPMTASTQWFERTLDDSANRRISLPEGFLAVDGILRLMQNVTAGLRVNEKIVAKFVADYLPFIATENLLMAAVERGGDRQQVHEIIRRASMRATEAMKNGEPWDLIAELAAEPTFGLTEAEIRAEMKPESYIGRCPEQVAAFTAKCRGLCTDAAKARADITL